MSGNSPHRETISKLSDYEKQFEDHERARKLGETASFATEEKLEMMVTQLEEANHIAEEADRRCEEVLRKCKIVENELDRVTEKAEDFEKQAVDFEDELRVPSGF